jgi:AraC-like DNA-binding protein
MRIAYEKVVPGAGRSFALLDSRKPAFDGRFHFHRELEITLIEGSAGRRVVGDSIERFSPGDLVLLGENLPHQYVSDVTRSGAPAVAKVIQFRKDFLGDTFLSAPEAAAIVDLLERSRRGLQFDGAVSQKAQRLVHAIFESSGFAQLLGLLELLHTLSADRAARAIASRGYTARISPRDSDTIDRALNYLNARFDQPIALAELCRHLNVTPATCNRLFQRSIGRSFKAMLIEMRIGHACRLLLETSSSVLDVAYSCGFRNLSNFNRRFKQVKACSPRAYRALMRR